MSLEFNGLLDASFDTQASYWEDEPDGPTCRLCGVCLVTPAEERRGLCDACYDAEQEEDVDEEE